MAGFTITVQGQAVQLALQALGERAANLGPVLSAIGQDITARAKARFDASAGPDGQTWAPKKHPNGRKTLVGETGDLRRQIISSVAGNQLQVTAGAPYAAIHQFGGTINKKAGQVTVRHRTDAKGELLRSAIMGGRGLIFAKASHKRALERSFDAAAHTINMPARPFMPVRAAGSLYEIEHKLILAQIEAYLAGEAAGPGRA